jgi:hypothetical protein
MSLNDGWFQSRALGVTEDCQQAVTQRALMTRILARPLLLDQAAKCPIIIFLEVDAKRGISLISTGYACRGGDDAFSLGTAERAEMLHRTLGSKVTEVMSTRGGGSQVIENRSRAGICGMGTQE